MNTRGYIVNCALESTGRQFQQFVQAGSEQEAMTLAAGNGVLVSSAYPAASEPSAHASSENTQTAESLLRLEAAFMDVSMELRRLRSARLLTSPITTIGWGVVCGMVFWMLIVISVWIIFFAVFAMLGIALGGASRGW